MFVLLFLCGVVQVATGPAIDWKAGWPGFHFRDTRCLERGGAELRNVRRIDLCMEIRWAEGDGWTGSWMRLFNLGLRPESGNSQGYVKRRIGRGRLARSALLGHGLSRSIRVYADIDYDVASHDTLPGELDMAGPGAEAFSIGTKIRSRRPVYLSITIHDTRVFWLVEDPGSFHVGIQSNTSLFSSPSCMLHVQDRLRVQGYGIHPMATDEIQNHSPLTNRSPHYPSAPLS